MWIRLLLLAACAVPVVLAFSSSSPSDSTSNHSGRRRFLKTVAIGGAVVGAAAWNKQQMLGPAPYRPPPQSLQDQVIVITGGTAGLGLESAKRLAAGGATVVLTSRTQPKGQVAVQAVQDYLKQLDIVNENVYALPLDLDDLENVKTFPKRLGTSPVGDKQITVLMNNAGVMAIPERQLTKDGYERTFQSNHLGHFLLTSQLMPRLADDATVINVSSEAHKFASKGLELDNLNGEKSYGPWSSYGQSKLANILFSKELQQRADQAGRKLTAVSLHPGAVQTDLARNLIGEEKWQTIQKEGPSFVDSLLFGVLGYFVIPVERGATTQVWLAARQAGSKIGGEYFNKCKVQSLGSAATDMDAAKKLWKASEEMIGQEFAKL